jgi:hypothetical protein
MTAADRIDAAVLRLEAAAAPPAPEPPVLKAEPDKAPDKRPEPKPHWINRRVGRNK